MPKFQIERQADGCHATQIYEVEADTPEQAYDLLREGRGTIVDHEFEVLGLEPLGPVTDMWEVTEDGTENQTHG